MNINPNVVIDNLSLSIAELSKENAILKAQLAAIQDEADKEVEEAQ